MQGQIELNIEKLRSLGGGDLCGHLNQSRSGVYFLSLDLDLSESRFSSNFCKTSFRSNFVSLDLDLIFQV